MSATEGITLACDLCGETVFLKYIGEREIDGGYTKWREYERAEGWDSIRFGDVVLADLCPSCRERLNDALLECVAGIRGEG